MFAGTPGPGWRSHGGVGRLTSRRRVLATLGTTGLGFAAGCSSLPGTDDDDPGIGQIGSGLQGRDISGGISMTEMPPLSGTLTVYSGRSEVLVGELVGYIEDLYDDLELRVRYGGATEMVSQIQTEGANSDADVFFSVNAGALGVLTEAGRTTPLPDEIAEMVRAPFRDTDNDWVGTSGRARTVPYNTDELTAADIPEAIQTFPEVEQFHGEMGWAPAYGSFQAFVTAMRLLEGDQATLEWLESMVAAGVRRYPDEFQICQAIADDEIDLGFTNHYYIQRIHDNRSNAPLDTAFTRGDAGAIFNVAGAAVVDTAPNPETAANFIRHLLSGEAQDYFARETFEYPLIPEVEPIGNLPPIDSLNPPDGVDLTQLSDLEPTIELMREAGVDI